MAAVFVYHQVKTTVNLRVTSRLPPLLPKTPLSASAILNSRHIPSHPSGLNWCNILKRIAAMPTAWQLDDPAEKRGVCVG